MSKFQELLTEAYKSELRDSNGKLNQTDRNTLRNELMEALAEDLNAVMTVDGAIVEFEHEYWGSLAVEVSVKMKDPNYDTEAAADEYAEKVAAAEAKKAEVLKRAAERQAKSEALKAARELKKISK